LIEHFEVVTKLNAISDVKGLLTDKEEDLMDLQNREAIHDSL
jgi:hypothetical protein